MGVKRVRTGAGWATDPGGGPDQWQVTYENVNGVGSFVTDPGGGPAQWQYDYSTSSYPGQQEAATDESSAPITDESGTTVTDE